MKKPFEAQSALAKIVAVFVLIGFIFASQAALAQPAVPQLTGPVLDEAGMLSAGERDRLAERIRASFDGGGPQMQVWTFPSLEGGDIAQIGIAAADAWQIGRKGKDDGVILLVAQRERKTRLEVGRGLEGAIPDILASRILREVLAPALRSGLSYDGMSGVVGAVEKYARGEAPLGAPQEPVKGKERRIPFGALFPLLFIVFILVQIIVRVVGGGRGGRGRRGGGFIFPGGWGGGGGGFGGGRGGGWSGGGGGFGGGGSSGDW